MQQRLLKPQHHTEPSSLPAVTQVSQPYAPDSPPDSPLQASPDLADPAISLHSFGDVPLFSRVASGPARQAHPIQTALAVSQSHDPAEQEAEHIADEVMADEMTPGDQHAEGQGRSKRQTTRTVTMVHRCGATPCNCSAEEREHKAAEAAEQAIAMMRGGDKDEDAHEDRLARSAEGTTPPVGGVDRRQIAALSGGSPLDAETRAFMEPRFGHNFGQVRVHTDEEAAASARTVRALAYTVGRDIVFAAGQYHPGTQSGRRLLAHELTHVVQQSDSPTVVQRQPDPQTPPTTQATPPAVDTTLSPGSPYAGLPPELLDTLRISFVERTDANRNLDNAFWAGPTTSFEEALNRIATLDIATLVEVYQRAKAAGIWTYIHSIRNIWSGTSRGFEFNSPFVNELSAALQQSEHFCKDTMIGEALHAGSCWRETVDGTPGLHVCLSSGVPGIHIDMHQTILGTITGVNPLGLNPFNNEPLLMPRTCFYDPRSVLEHWNDLSGSGDESIFARIGRERATINNLRSEYSRNAPDGQSQYLPEIPGDLNAAERKLDTLEPVLRRFAVEGFKGEQDASAAPDVTETFRQVDETIQNVRRLLDNVAPPPGVRPAPGG